MYSCQAVKAFKRKYFSDFALNTTVKFLSGDSNHFDNTSFKKMSKLELNKPYNAKVTTQKLKQAKNKVLAIAVQ